MKKAIYVIILVVLTVSAYFFGKYTVSTECGQTFYATIEDINEDSFFVQGLEVNDINYRGRFHFVVSESTKLEWRGTEISKSDLKVGARISVTFVGPIKETDPAGIEEVSKIQLLEDEK